MTQSLIRYCPECSTIGEIDLNKHYSCCPDGSKAIYVHPVVAEQAKRGFHSEITLPHDTELVKIMLKAAAKTMNWEEGMKLALKALFPYLKREYGSYAGSELARTINEGQNNDLSMPDSLNPRTSRAGSQAPDNQTEIEGQNT